MGNSKTSRMLETENRTTLVDGFHVRPTIQEPNLLPILDGLSLNLKCLIQRSPGRQPLKSSSCLLTKSEVKIDSSFQL